jgi:hypothetical protein
VYRQAPKTVRAWVTSICRDWPFTQIIPAHFAAPIKATPAEFKEAFAFLFEDPNAKKRRPTSLGGFVRAFFGVNSGDDSAAANGTAAAAAGAGAGPQQTERVMISGPSTPGKPLSADDKEALQRGDRKTLDTLFDILLKIGAVDPNPERDIR